MNSIIQEIIAALGKRDGISEDAMRPLAQRYAAEVDRVNTRLSTSVALLHKGLRSEAIQSASITPNAIDDAAGLDFAEAEEWFDILQFLNIDVPATLQRDLAEQLNEAIVETQPLEVLLKMHRRLAIARAPLAWRLKTLRRIAAADPLNGVWSTDVDAWEKVRLKQIVAAAPAVIASGEPASLQELATELADPAWQTTPNASVLKKVQAKLRQIDEQETRDELARLAPQLYDAFCQFDEPTARSLITRWNSTAAKVGGDVDTQLVEQVDGAIAWVTEMDRESELRRQRAAAIGSLEAALDRGDPSVELERLYHQTRLFDEPPPSELLQRYQSNLEERATSKQRRFQLLVGAILAATVLIIGMLAWRQYQSNENQRFASAENEFRDLVEGKNLLSARSFIDTLQESSPDVAASASILSLATKLTGLESDEAIRVEQFGKHLAAARSDEPSKIDLIALDRADDLALTEAEKSEVFGLRRRQSQWQAGRRSEQTDKLIADVKQLRTDVDLVEEAAMTQGTVGKLAEVSDQLDRLPRTYPLANVESKDQVKQLAARVKSMSDAIVSSLRRNAEQTQSLGRVFAAGSLPQLATALNAFAREFPKAPLTTEFARAAAEEEQWQEGLVWNDYLREATKALTGGMTDSQIDAYETAKSAMIRRINTPPGKLPSSAETRLSSMKKRSEILDRVLNGLKRTVIADLITVIESAEPHQRYFVYRNFYQRNREKLFQPNEITPEHSLEVVADAGGTVKRKTLNGITLEVIEEPYATIQWIIGRRQTHEKKFLTDWTGEFMKLVAELKGRSELDGAVKELLMQHLLVGACEGSDRLSQELAKELSDFKTNSNAQSTWFEPDGYTTAINPKIEATVVPQLAASYQSRPMPALETEAIRRLACSWIGTLDRVDGKDVGVRLRSKPGGDGRLWVIQTSSTNASMVDYVAVGTLRGGTAQLTGPKQALIAGRPVFFCVDR